MRLNMHKVSTTSRPILLFCAENNIEMEYKVIDLMTGEHMQEPYINLNPSKQVPVLEDGDFVLTESSAILKYLADKMDSPAYPKGLKERAHVNEVMDWFNTGFLREYGYHMIYPQVYPHHARQPEEGNKVTVDWGKTQIEQLWLGVLNDHWLKGGPDYLCGNQMTIADYFGSCIVTLGELVRVNFSKYGNIDKWLKNMKGLPSWNSVNDVHDGYAGSLKEKTFVSIA